MTPVAELESDALERLEEYVAEFAGGFGYITRTRWAGFYLQGLFLDGERKSIEPLSRRVSVPGWHGDTEQALQRFVNQSVWDEQAVLQTYRRVMGEAFDDPDGIVVIDDTGFAKKGHYSVGVARQYSGTLGKTDNCQVAVSLHCRSQGRLSVGVAFVSARVVDQPARANGGGAGPTAAPGASHQE